MYLKYKFGESENYTKKFPWQTFSSEMNEKEKKKTTYKAKNWTKFVFVGAAVTQMWIIQSNLFI